jgi:HAD superfamily hydrolase (TIGR01484 family)
MLNSLELKQKVEQIKVIYSDVDGTFMNAGCLFKNKYQLSIKNTLSIFKLLKKRIDVVMTSGREKEKLKETARILGFNNFIANLGIEIVYNQGEKVITNHGVHIPSDKSLKKWIEESGVIQSIFNKYSNKIRYYSPWAEILRTHHLLIGELDFNEVSNWIQKNYPTLRIIDNGVVPPETDFSKPHAYHVIPKNVGKKEAVRIDKNERNLKSENLIGIGDSMEDATIAEEVGVFFLLDESVKTDRSNVYYIDNHDGEGFSRVIDILDSQNLL